MNTRKHSVHRHAPTTLSDSSAADPPKLVTVEATRHEARAEVANQDSLVEARAQIVNPLWMVTVGLAILLALLAIFSVSG